MSQVKPQVQFNHIILELERKITICKFVVVAFTCESVRLFWLTVTHQTTLMAYEEWRM